MSGFLLNELTAMNPVHETENCKDLSSGKLGEKVIEKNDNSVTIEFSVPDTIPYFDGHFPEFPILPAIAQIELVIRFASHFFGIGIDISEIQRIKFSNLIRPFTPLALKLEKDEETISFKMFSLNGQTSYSTGTLKIRKTAKSKDTL